ncbi:DUF485 domain-containing protein [Conchiformibius kuhniae]|uniref:DUF485 domain-containing protein n=1 Tax=Conchiformibius kuhniae TaxID=211502 RepID=A0A8T9MUF5_9NEIS|nr:DUF485 domain-containing protein [Conchiformibius kuhniae]UOP04919.1 DUF485 domain-containing protein [Conchiformibius kuhniae]
MAEQAQSPSAGEEARVAAQVLAHPKFQNMAKQKALVGWTFSAVIFAVYVGYIWIIGTDPQFFAAKMAENGVTTLGIYAGVFVILFSFVITLVYVAVANGKFEQATRQVVDEVMKNGNKETQHGQ